MNHAVSGISLVRITQPRNSWCRSGELTLNDDVEVVTVGKRGGTTTGKKVCTQTNSDA
eukprot:SAG22_NODE_6525_length_843_cov_0.932796_1_plen_57_part_10